MKIVLAEKMKDYLYHNTSAYALPYIILSQKLNRSRGSHDDTASGWLSFTRSPSYKHSPKANTEADGRFVFDRMKLQLKVRLENHSDVKGMGSKQGRLEAETRTKSDVSFDYGLVRVEVSRAGLKSCMDWLKAHRLMVNLYEESKATGKKLVFPHGKIYRDEMEIIDEDASEGEDSTWWRDMEKANITKVEAFMKSNKFKIVNSFDAWR